MIGTFSKIPDVILLEPKVFHDERGFFFESFNQKEFNHLVGKEINFVQDNHSKSKKGVIRGLHFQSSPMGQGKLVRVIDGEIWDVAVDIRPNSSTYGQWVGEELSSHNKKQLWIPEGFAHGFLVISETAEVVYKTTNYYSQAHEQTIHWKNNEFNIQKYMIVEVI
jgi:dTDP-4-dehydrorhamnose 3,5-epimerase